VVLGGGYGLFSTAGIYISPATTLLLLFAGSGILNLVKYGLEARKVYVRTRELSVAQNATILGMTFLAGSRDEETVEHILRTQHYVAALARRLCQHEKHRSELTDENIELLFKSAPLHDIGKVGIPDAILRKPGLLTEEEYLVIMKHPEIGQSALANTKNLLQQQSALGYLDYACQVTISHHEKWDGSGYPYGLKGDQIPLAGRLMALADVYDALISIRIYKPAYPHELAKEMILAASGEHFDPDVVAAFVACEEEFLQIARKFSDHQTSID
jgi:adenylate cyclase